jgi:hypothetical protein
VRVTAPRYRYVGSSFVPLAGFSEYHV